MFKKSSGHRLRKQEEINSRILWMWKKLEKWTVVMLKIQCTKQYFVTADTPPPQLSNTALSPAVFTMRGGGWVER